jgi:type IV pilus assembly protein PilA
MDDWSKYEAVVAKRWGYYHPRFERFTRGEWLSWNWPAFFATFAWLRYRKLYAWSWVYFFVSTPFLLVVLLVVFAGDSCERALDPIPSSVAGVTVLALLALGWILPPLAANHLYFRHVQALIGKGEGGTSRGFISALALQALVVIVPAAALPSYANYKYRARVSEGVLLAGAAKAALQDYLNEHQRLPARIDEVTKEVSNRHVDRLALESDGTITAIFGGTSEKLSGHSVSFVSQRKDGRIVDWVCRSKDLPDRCLPPRCRQP